MSAFDMLGTWFSVSFLHQIIIRFFVETVDEPSSMW